ncbi:MAG: Arc family DNA-binding protein [Ruminococcus flavefaciens]|nr:Arc family DNA-binding protein [Ruminococcus flavefaciens]
MPSDLPRITLRMDQEFIDKINKIAERENRSTNQQIAYIIKKYIEQYEQENGRINSAELSVTKTG